MELLSFPSFPDRSPESFTSTQATNKLDEQSFSSGTSARQELSPVPAEVKPVWMSYFEKDYFCDEEICHLMSTNWKEIFKKATTLKKEADKQEQGGFSLFRGLLYLESIMYFTLGGMIVEKNGKPNAALDIFNDTRQLADFIGTHCQQKLASESIVVVLSLRCQALLFLMKYKLSEITTFEAGRELSKYFEEQPSTQHESESSEDSDGQEITKQRRCANSEPIPVITCARFLRSMDLIMAHQKWDYGDNIVQERHLEDFFVDLERTCGMLTMHSSLLHLVKYIKLGVSKLQKLTNSQKYLT